METLSAAEGKLREKGILAKFNITIINDDGDGDDDSSFVSP